MFIPATILETVFEREGFTLLPLSGYEYEDQLVFRGSSGANVVFDVKWRGVRRGVLLGALAEDLGKVDMRLLARIIPMVLAELSA